VDNPYYTITGANGKFTLKDIPPGEYQVSVWPALIPVLEPTIIIQPNKTTEINSEVEILQEFDNSIRYEN